MPIPSWPPGRQCSRAGQQGFTLLEVLVAGTILSIVLAALYGVFSQTLTSQRRAEAQAARSRAARIVLLRLGDELRASPPMPASSHGFLGELQREGRYPATVLTFVSALPSMHSVPGVDGGLSTLRYRLVPEEAGAVRYRLIRQVSHDIGANREPPDQAVGAYPLISHVRGFRARFFDGRQWQDEWGQDSASSQLPRAVEIRLYLPEFGIRDLLSRYNETGFAKQWGQPAQGRSRRRALSREKSLCQIIVYARIHISA